MPLTIPSTAEIDAELAWLRDRAHGLRRLRKVAEQMEAERTHQPFLFNPLSETEDTKLKRLYGHLADERTEIK